MSGDKTNDSWYSVTVSLTPPGPPTQPLSSLLPTHLGAAAFTFSESSLADYYAGY